MYANTLAISRIAKMKGDERLPRIYLNRAEKMKENLQTDLWNESFLHFTDMCKTDNKFVHYWDFKTHRLYTPQYYLNMVNSDEIAATKIKKEYNESVVFEIQLYLG